MTAAALPVLLIRPTPRPTDLLHVRACYVPQSLPPSSKAETAAKVSEQAERYKDMVKHVKAVRGAAGVVVVCNVLSRWPRGTCLGTPCCAS